MTYLEHDPKPVWSTWELENIYEWMQDLVKGAQILPMLCKEVAQVKPVLIGQGPPWGPGSPSISFIQICILLVFLST